MAINDSLIKGLFFVDLYVGFCLVGSFFYGDCHLTEDFTTRLLLVRVIFAFALFPESRGIFSYSTSRGVRYDFI